MKVPDLTGKLRAAQFGHDDVGEENVDGAGMMAGEFEGVQGALRLQNLMAGRAQVFHDGQAHAVVSEDAQDRTLQHRAKKSEFTCVSFSAKDTRWRLAALQSPESRKLFSAWFTVARMADFFPSSSLMRWCSGMSFMAAEGVPAALFPRCTRRTTAPASSRSSIPIARPGHAEAVARRRARKVIELAR